MLTLSVYFIVKKNIYRPNDGVKVQLYNKAKKYIIE